MRIFSRENISTCLAVAAALAVTGGVISKKNTEACKILSTAEDISRSYRYYLDVQLFTSRGDMKENFETGVVWAALESDRDIRKQPVHMQDGLRHARHIRIEVVCIRSSGTRSSAGGIINMNLVQARPDELKVRYRMRGEYYLSPPYRREKIDRDLDIGYAASPQ